MLTAREPVEHELKIWPSQFAALLSLDKLHEVRRFDRDFRIGDYLRLREFEPEAERYTGREVRAIVSWITEPGTFGLPSEVGVMSIQGVIETTKAKAQRREPSTCGRCLYEESNGELIEQCAACKSSDAEMKPQPKIDRAGGDRPALNPAAAWPFPTRVK